MKLFFTFIITFCSLLSVAQTKEESLGELKAGKLYVTIYDTTDATSANFCKNYNYNVRSAFASRWNFCPVEYITFDKIDVLKEKEENAFVVLPLEYNYTVQTNDFSRRYRAGGSVAYFIMGRAKDYIITKNLFGKNRAATFSKPIHKVAMTDFGFISVFIGVDVMNKSFQKGILSKEDLKAQKEAKKSQEEKEGPRRAQLKTKTLLVDKDLLEKDLDEATIKAVYKHPFKIVDFSEIQKALITKKDNVAFFTIRMLSSTKPKDLLMVLNNDIESLGYITINVGADVSKDNFEELNKIAEKD